MFNAQGELLDLIRLLHSSLRAPLVSRLRHFYTPRGRQQRKLVLAHTRLLHEQMTLRLTGLSQLAEEFKAAGLPANEATRLRQHFQNMTLSINQLRFIKHYRTPLGLRAFGRIFILILPILFGPYYASFAAATNIGFVIFFSIAMSLALHGLFNIRTELEDPFMLSGRHVSPYDVIDVDRELGDLEADLVISGGKDASTAVAASVAVAFGPRVQNLAAHPT